MTSYKELKTKAPDMATALVEVVAGEMLECKDNFLYTLKFEDGDVLYVLPQEVYRVCCMGLTAYDKDFYIIDRVVNDILGGYMYTEKMRYMNIIREGVMVHINDELMEDIRQALTGRRFFVMSLSVK